MPCAGHEVAGHNRQAKCQRGLIPLELPEELEVDESELPRLDEQTYVTAWLETCAGRRGTVVGRREPRLHRLADARRP